MMNFVRYTGFPVWSHFHIHSIRVTHQLSLYWLNVVAGAILIVAAILSLLVYVYPASIQIGDAEQSVSSALFFSDCTIDGSLPPFYGYRLGFLYNFGCRLAQQALR